jgi:1-acyl-sn-glycerol-3-phosphate acyltransferase
MERLLAAHDDHLLSQTMAYLRWALVLPWFLFWTVVCGLGSVVGSVTPWRKPIAAFFERTWGRMVLWAARCPVVVQRQAGVELPRGGFVFASNHQGILDILALFVALQERPFVFAAKKVLFRIPIIGWHLRSAEYIEVDRDNPERAVAAMKAAVDKVRAGTVVLVYPEGTRSPDGTVLPFKKGAFHLALDAQVPIVPVAVEGAQKAMKKHTVRLYGHPIRVHIGQPIPTQGMTCDELLRRTRKSILALHRGIGGLPSPEEPMAAPSRKGTA